MNEMEIKAKIDELIKNRFPDGVAKSAKIKAREFRALRRTYSTPQGIGARGYRTFYDVGKIVSR